MFINAVKHITITIFALFLSTTVAANSKIGIVDADMVVQKSKKGVKFFSELQAFNEKKKQEVNELVESYREQQKDAQAKAANMSEDEVREVTKELQDFQTKIKRAQEDANREAQTKFNQGVEGFRKELAPIIRQVSIEQKLDAVFNFSPNSNIVFFSDSVNITDLVIEKFDQVNKSTED